MRDVIHTKKAGKEYGKLSMEEEEEEEEEKRNYIYIYFFLYFRLESYMVIAST